MLKGSPLMPMLAKEAMPEDIRTVEEALLAVRVTAALPPRRHSTDEALVSLTAGRTRGICMFALFGMLERASRFIEFLVLYRSFSEELSGFLERVSHHIRELNTESEGAAAAALRIHENYMYLLRNPEEYEKVGEEFYNDRLNAWPLQMIYLVCCFFVTTLR
ncbi:hypothetical protein STCU_10780 [Strigomonas culicis]|uniref:Uncharacterized protein n=1 Tax=Strigomonas culicis TaxID=28005 RepID=S9URG9_9TRYP|nr:hypothetical protein STCU_10780 [Strigomonas culicis]|eukprot:EPY17176.1 hypothetical protein STCU_10780 [Strigomonas culicis]